AHGMAASSPAAAHLTAVARQRFKELSPRNRALSYLPARVGPRESRVDRARSIGVAWLDRAEGADHHRRTTGDSTRARLPAGPGAAGPGRAPARPAVPRPGRRALLPALPPGPAAARRRPHLRGHVLSSARRRRAGPR